MPWKPEFFQGMSLDCSRTLKKILKYVKNRRSRRKISPYSNSVCFFAVRTVRVRVFSLVNKTTVKNSRNKFHREYLRCLLIFIRKLKRYNFIFAAMQIPCKFEQNRPKDVASYLHGLIISDFATLSFTIKKIASCIEWMRLYGQNTPTRMAVGVRRPRTGHRGVVELEAVTVAIIVPQIRQFYHKMPGGGGWPLLKIVMVLGLMKLEARNITLIFFVSLNK